MPFAAKSPRLARVFSFTALKESVFAWQLGPEPAPLTDTFSLLLHRLDFFPLGLHTEASG